MVRKPITMKFKLSGGENSVIPTNFIETLLINVRDGSATYRFNNASITKKFTIRQNQDGVKSKYIERLQTCICLYPDMTQQQIVKHISEKIKSMEKK